MLRAFFGLLLVGCGLIASCGMLGDVATAPTNDRLLSFMTVSPFLTVALAVAGFGVIVLARESRSGV